MEIIIKGRYDHFGKTRSEQEKNMRKEWGSTISDEQLDKLKYAERKIKDINGSKKNFIRGQDVDNIGKIDKKPMISNLVIRRGRPYYIGVRDGRVITTAHKEDFTEK